MKLIGASIPLPPSQVLGCRRVRWAAGLGLAGLALLGSDFREQPGGGVQQVGRGDCAGGLVLEQSHQLVRQSQLVLRGGAITQVLQACGPGPPGAGRSGAGLIGRPGRRWRREFLAVEAAPAPGTRQVVLGRGRGARWGIGWQLSWAFGYCRGSPGRAGLGF
jgi:hypothetical protein